MTAGALSLLARHRAGLLASVRRRVRPPVEPADIVQEAFVRAIPAIEAGRVVDVQAFVHGIARNLSAEAMRQQQRWSLWLVDADQTEHVADDAPSPEAHAAGRDELERLHDAMASLPPRCREVFALRHVELLEKAEIAERLGIHIKQVEKQLRHALVLCARILDDQGRET
ncbi:RNA polymerase sigma factor [Novosphingobium sp.]|uniref:RNA polymerase sigma factor n=1 Tax=Novosphingobium sp. TaxID=1874826 RepID=UPI0028ACD29F|nr:RNA polymerase sigma factor [Novosphingobium sp.]